jgi:hypothetical protein
MRMKIICNLLAQYAPAWRRPLKEKMGLVLFSSTLFIFMSTCIPQVIQTPVLTQAPADILSILVKVQGQYAEANTIDIDFFFANKEGDTVRLSVKQSMLCDGLASSHLGNLAMLPRKPAGSAYQCVYTDEKGKKTPLNIPVPPGTLAITSPASGAAVQIPGSPDLTPGAFPRPPERTGTLTVRYTTPTLPSDASAQIINGEATCGSGVRPACGVVAGGQAPTTGSYTLTDATQHYGFGFETFTAGSSGKIQLQSMLAWPLAASGFHSVRVEYDDTLSVPVTWSRG